jgi:hypothetical protein
MRAEAFFLKKATHLRIMKFLGYCHVVALIMHRLTGCPICVFYGFRKEKKEKVLVHAGVLWGRKFIDETGIWDGSLDEIETYLQEQNQPYDSIRVYILKESSLKWKAILKRTNAEKVGMSKYMQIFFFVSKVLIPHLKKGRVYAIK